MKPLLIILNGERAGERLLLEKGKRYIMGRDQAADICLPEKKISRRHASIIWEGDAEIFLEDLGSLNGTSVNGDLISGATPVQDGDRVQVGSYLLQIQIPEPSQESVNRAQTDRKAKGEAELDFKILPIGAPLDASFSEMDADASLTGGRLISGKLDEISLSDLLQMLAQTKKSGCLVLSNNKITHAPHSERGSRESSLLFLNEGDLEYAIDGDLVGEEAFFQSLHRTAGYFALFPFGAEKRHNATITTPLEALLLEGFRRIDEERANQEAIAMKDSFEVQPDEPLGSLSPEELSVFQAVWKHKRVSAVVDLLPMEPDEVLNIIKRLARGGFILKVKSKN